MIKSEDISVIVQGRVCPITDACISSFRHFLPNAEIILSTFEDANTSNVECNKIIKSQDPGSYYYINSEKKENNVNRQIISTMAGLKVATRKYTFKLRTDFKLTGNSFLDFWDKFEKTNKNHQLFSHKILACCYFARNPTSNYYSLLFHPSDIAFFGQTSDLINLFDIPLMKKEEEIYYTNKKGIFRNKYTPEQHIFVNCIKKNGHLINFESQYDNTTENIEQTERYFASNFIFLDWEQFNLQPPNKFKNTQQNHYPSCITHIEWQKLYKKYVDSTITIPHNDKQRKKLKQIEIKTKFIMFIARVATLPFFRKSHKKLRQKIRSKIATSLGRLT